MSGGKYDYAFMRINEFVCQMHTRKKNECSGQFDGHEISQRVAFQSLLVRICKAMHAIEWVDSGDYAPGDEFAAIADCFSAQP